MNLARVIGRIVSTHKQDGLAGRKLLVLAPLDASRKQTGPPLVAVDAIGAGAAELVLYVRGREAAHAFLPDEVPTDAGVVAIVDHVTLEKAP